MMAIMNRYVTAPARLGETPLPDGRLVGWAEWGPEDGVPVLLCPGAATSRWLGFGPDVVAARGLRMVSLDRPGLGASTPHPGRTFADFAADVRHLAARRGLGRPPVVGNSQGAPFALACAEADVVAAVAVVSGADDVASAVAPAAASGAPADEGRRPDEPAATRFAAAVPAHVRELVGRTAADPRGAEEFFAGFTADAMAHLVRTSSPACDLAVYQDPGFDAAYRRALDEGFAQGAAAGYARDAVLAMSRWPFALDRITVPVDLWYGAHDASHSPDHGARLAARIPGARRHVVPGAGGSLLWTDPGPILATLLDRAAGKG
ncbi:Pimeloyl-ACP methyl ester carboxylesterase [Streptomyces yunnanensis]|uniref:Pimeloyl-ACP methyl ester carboxylesterase n=2 Tax=Streptomyces yunnanensis TaxID=156453 RepID=A0A9X8MQM1_9ACTN|nr:Pimeloyl-ACP methyl ester carboxylesterase [Streptomyces yunnanensis]